MLVHIQPYFLKMGRGQYHSVLLSFLFNFPHFKVPVVEYVPIKMKNIFP